MFAKRRGPWIVLKVVEQGSGIEKRDGGDAKRHDSSLDGRRCDRMRDDAAER
jgi:hypothetical protein